MSTSNKVSRFTSLISGPTEFAGLRFAYWRDNRYNNIYDISDAGIAVSPLYTNPNQLYRSGLLLYIDTRRPSVVSRDDLMFFTTNRVGGITPYSIMESTLSRDALRGMFTPVLGEAITNRIIPYVVGDRNIRGESMRDLTEEQRWIRAQNDTLALLQRYGVRLMQRAIDEYAGSSPPALIHNPRDISL